MRDGNYETNKIGWEAGIRTPIGRSRVCSPTVGRPPSREERTLEIREFLTLRSRSCQMGFSHSALAPLGFAKAGGSCYLHPSLALT